MKAITRVILEKSINRHPDLERCRGGIEQAYEAWLACCRSGGAILTCGNGGSAADSLHIVGELVKGFALPRPIANELRQRLVDVDLELGADLAPLLQTPIRAQSLVAEAALVTAVANDNDAAAIYAQQVLAHGRAGDVLVAISTSGNSKNVINAAIAAKALGLSVVALTGPSGGRLANFADVAILAPGSTTFEIQELHLPIYHALCLMLEAEVFGDDV